MTETNEISCSNIRSVVTGSEYQWSSERPGSTAFDPTLIFTCEGGWVTAAASVSDCPSSSSTSWMVGVTAEGGSEVFFFFRFFLRFLSVLCARLRIRWGRWVDKGWCVWCIARLWSGEGNRQKKKEGNCRYSRADNVLLWVRLQPTSTLSLLKWRGSPQIRSSVYSGD